MEAKDIIKKIKQIEISTKNIVEEMFAGEYHSLFKGQGLEFSEVREYTPGDNYRLIDWNVTARTQKPFIKTFEETRELNVIFLVDCSASNMFGTKNQLKSEYIAEITAVLSFSALMNHDKCGLVMFSDKIEKYIPPSKGKKSALKMLREILFYEPENQGTDINKAIQFISKVIKKRSIVFLISDFLDSGFEDSLKYLAKKHDVIALRVTDPAEIEIPDAGIIHFVDPETGEDMMVNTSDKQFRDNYTKEILELEFATNRSFKDSKVDALDLHTDQSYVAELQKFFMRRLKRRRR
ncbi:MAG: DUF58 domain-containing protein [Candidatus Cloacimonetes bacterium 4572_65]|nr:MAG: DUF58 domain-containing protein [Candidatus Cloacimonetes bacterium 4572_65]